MLEVPAAVEVVVSSDGRVLRARRPGQAAFTEFPVIEQCGDPPIVGEPRIRHHRVEGDHVTVTYGKHCVATIHLDTGKLTCKGCD